MYEAFFGFNDRPFKLVPDPAYFFLGPSHEEALAHLEFAVRQGEGFTLITGEVGTGKTTLCRRFLENLGDDTEVAYIFNPVLGVVELLQAINEEYGIAFDADLPRDLINRLNAFLLEMKARNRRVVLLIDEAQNLSPDVLEQLRLLSNLETTRSKLLQIILVGQPELNDLLASRKLRQLGQRISLNCCLLPLTRPETEKYIAYRVSVASNRAERVFTPGAVREIYRFSRGIPRLINTICDRALLAAFSRNETHVSRRVARLAAKELRNHRAGRRAVLPLRFRWPWALVAVCLIAGLGFWAVPKMFTANPFSGAVAAPKKEPVTQPVEMPPPAGKKESALTIPLEGPAKPPSDLKTAALPAHGGATAGFKQWLTVPGPEEPRRDAIAAVLGLWRQDVNIPAAADDSLNDWDFFRQVAGANGLKVYRIRGNPALAAKINLPAIMVFDVGHATRYLVLTEWEKENLTLTSGDRETTVSVRDLLQTGWRWACVFWKDFEGLYGTIPGDASAETILTLKKLLRQMGFSGVALTADYDDVTKRIVKKIQVRGGIPVDGLVGPVTKMIIYNDLKLYQVPSIGAGADSSG